MGVIGLLLSLINVLVALTVSWTVIGFKEAIYFIFDIGQYFNRRVIYPRTLIVIIVLFVVKLSKVTVLGNSPQ